LLAVEARPGVKRCEKCGGVFADLATSNRILEAMDRQLLAIGFEAARGKQKPRDEGHPVTCPECQIQMVKNRIESAACEVDACPLHGTWFDTNELVDVMRAFDSARRKGIQLKRNVPSAPINLDPGNPAEHLPRASSRFDDWLDSWLG
jgi:Zn-finger nucleic acid-binding protein